jgi:diphosphomevalonate decarboxylase
MHAGSLATGEDAFAEPIESLLVERVRMVIAVVGGGTKKKQGSRDAMDHCAETSPLYPAWIAQVPRDLKTAEAAIRAGDLEALGTLAEANALAMHATAIASRPAIIYWQPTTIQLLDAVRQLRADGVHAWATMDAGPHVKVLTTPGDAQKVAAALGEIEGVSTTISTAGGPVRIVEEKQS